MDWDRIALLLEIYHKTLNVVGTENIRKAVIAELSVHNNPVPKVAPAQPELPLETKERRL